MLDSKTLQIAHDVRDLTARGLEALSRSQADTTALRQALLDLDGPFLLVVAGEFNSGKTSLLNALLGKEYLKEGVTPTTDRIHLISYGPEFELKPQSPELSLVQIPNELLKDLRLVDTPGTNAILQHHQVLTEKFLPRADLILFITSADRPYTQSEAQFLDLIRAWGKKIVLVVNKMDLHTEQELEQILAFVRKGADQTLGQVPPVFAVSARKAKQGDPASRVGELEAHIRKVLSTEAATIKLGSPLGVLIKLVEEAKPELGAKLKNIEEQLTTCRELDALATRHDERIRRDFEGQIALVVQQLEAVRSRAETWLDEKVRLSNFIELLQSAKLKQSFMDNVVKGANADIERGVLQAMNWLAKRDRELLEDALHLLREAPSLRQTVSSTSEGQMIEGNLETALKAFKPEEEAQMLKEHIQEALQQTALVEVGAVGLGAGLLLVFQKVLLDLLGVFAGIAVAFLGFSILPRRKEAAKKRLRERLQELRGKLEAALAESLDAELRNTRERFQGLYRTPCLRLENSRDSILNQQSQLEGLHNEALELRKRLQ